MAYQGQVSVDYVAYVGNVSYGAAASNQTCNSGFVVFTPVAADNQSGTHIYVAGNFSIASSNPANSNCIDGNGFIFDTFDGSTSNEPVPYAQQAVIENNIAVGNGGVGVRVVYSSSGSRAFSDIYLVNNTMWGNSAGTYQAGNSNCGEMQLLLSENVTGERNLAVTNQSGCYGVSANPNTAYSAINEDSTTSMSNNWGYAVPGGTSSRAYMQYSNHASSFQFDSSNPFGADPIFAEPVAPGAPGCAGSASVPLCMAQVIADFTPKIQAAQPYGYQLPSNQPAYNPLFPGWLCNVNLPTGLVTMGC